MLGRSRHWSAWIVCLTPPLALVALLWAWHTDSSDSAAVLAWVVGVLVALSFIPGLAMIGPARTKVLTAVGVTSYVFLAGLLVLMFLAVHRVATQMCRDVLRGQGTAIQMNPQDASFTNILTGYSTCSIRAADGSIVKVKIVIVKVASGIIWPWSAQ